MLHKINFGWCQKVKNCHFNNFGAFEFSFLAKCHTWKCQKFPKIQTSEVLKWAKWQFLGYKMTNYWFHVKSDMQKNHEISTLCILNYAAQVCMDRLKIIEAGKSRWFCDVIPMPQHSFKPQSLASLEALCQLATYGWLLKVWCLKLSKWKTVWRNLTKVLTYILKAHDFLHFINQMKSYNFFV